MAFKTLLTVTGSDFSERDLLVATDLCDQIEAHLSVLIVALAAPPPVGEYAAMVSDVWQEQRREDMKELQTRTTDVSKFLAKSALSSDLSSEYKDIAWTDEAIGRRARYADLTVVGPEMLASETLKDKVIEGVLFSSGKPLLLLPDGSRPTIKPSRVMIAWDSGVEASRAVREFARYSRWGRGGAHCTGRPGRGREQAWCGAWSRRRRLSRAPRSEGDRRPSAEPRQDGRLCAATARSGYRS